jgi:hypothetical protein
MRVVAGVRPDLRAARRASFAGSIRFFLRFFMFGNQNVFRRYSVERQDGDTSRLSLLCARMPH